MRGTRSRGRRPRLPLSVRDLWWVSCAVVVGTVVATAYLLTHPYPAYGAGLYLEVAKQILSHGYRLPETIPYYTAGGVPFAYPPFVFYASAVALDVASVDPITLSRYAPAFLTVLYLVPYYFLSRELLGGRTQAGMATILLAVTPPTLQWHLSAGGLVRATAFLFTLTGAYTGLRLFRGGSAWWLVPSTLLFGVTILTHPVYTVFFGVSYLLFYLTFDRSVRGLLRGSVVAVGGLCLASPWWLYVVRTHGIGVFTAAAGTHTGLFGGTHRLLDQFVYPLVMGPPVPVFFVVSFAGLFYFVGQRRLFLPAWLVTGAVVIGKERFQFVPGSMMAAVFLLTVSRTLARRRVPAADWRRVANAAVAAVVVAGVVLGVMFSAAALPQAHAGSPSQPQFIDRADERAMTWVARYTATSTTFVVLGDAAEWFPLLTDRTILVGPWGVEWTTPSKYETQLSQYRTLSTCGNAQCVTRRLRRGDDGPDYLYVPKGRYTVRGTRRENTTSLRRSLDQSPRYRLVYENSGVALYRVGALSDADAPPRASGGVDGKRRVRCYSGA